jgi:hypothetical protein
MDTAEGPIRNASTRTVRRTRGYFLLVGLIGLIAGFSVVTDVGAALSGVAPAISRTLIGILGLVAVAFMWFKPPQGKLLGTIWALVQIPYFATSLGGSFTAQNVSLPLALAFPSTVDGQSSVSSIGINLVGVIFAVWLSLRGDLFEYRDDIAA